MRGAQTIVLTGGGSGGHITPILAVADELKKQKPDTRVIYIGQTGDGLGDIPRLHPSIDEVYTVRAGKFRRYHSKGILQVFDIPTLLKNIRDAFYVIIGFLQSWFLLRRLKPSVVFVRGGYVGVPVGLAAARHKIPYLTHDSDAIPSLANRIISKKAAAHAVALPKENYQYPQDKTFAVGIPLNDAYQPVTPKLEHEYRDGLHIREDSKVICITGGGLGAERLNDAMKTIVPKLMEKYHQLVVIHIAGRKHEAKVHEFYKQNLSQSQLEHLLIRGFVNDLYRYSAASDLIVARAGATNLAEFAMQRKACIIVPNPLLAAGHQIKNAKSLAEQGAIRVVEEGDKLSDELFTTIVELLDSTEKRMRLAEEFGKFAKPNATEDVVGLIVQTANKRGSKQSVKG